MNKLNYCPKCGSQTLVWNAINKWSCTACDFVLYNNCAAAVAVLLRYKDEIFFTVRSRDPQKGKLDLSGGFVDPNETAEEACKRELYEELQLNIDLSKLKILGTQPNIYQYKGIDYNTLDIFYEYELDIRFSPELELSEVSAGIWYKKDQIPLEDLAFESQKKFFRTYFPQQS